MSSTIPSISVYIWELTNGTAMIAKLKPKIEIMDNDRLSSCSYPISANFFWVTSLVSAVSVREEDNLRLRKQIKTEYM
jgi:hypothetical protein